jgi:RNA-directed DNA polymerase
MFTQELWDDWLSKELVNYTYIKDKNSGKRKRKYLKKGYLHLDKRVWLLDEQTRFKALLQNPKKISERAFYPFLKFILKVPRYKYDTKRGCRRIEHKKRPINFASHTDALIYSFYSHCLTKQYEDYIRQNGIDECVLAYRTDLGASNIDFARDVFDNVKGRGQCTVLALDIKGFFDHLDHETLLQQWKKILCAEKDDDDHCQRFGVEKLDNDQYKLFRSLTKFSYINKNSLLRFTATNLATIDPKPQSLLELVPGDKDSSKFDALRKANIIVTNTNSFGIPQGSPISALMSNIYMAGYDKEMNDFIIGIGGVYRRYCDDILIIVDTPNIESARDFAYAKIATLKLTIQKKKEEEIIFQKNHAGKIRSFNAKKLRDLPPPVLNKANEHKYLKPLQYLGFEFDGQDSRIRSSSLSRYFRKAKARVTKTVKMAYSPISKGKRIFKKKLFHRYTHLGKRNFVSYALNASRDSYDTSRGETKTGMNSVAIKKQLSRHVKKIFFDISQKNTRRITNKSNKGKLKSIKE